MKKGRRAGQGGKENRRRGGGRGGERREGRKGWREERKEEKGRKTIILPEHSNSGSVHTRRSSDGKTYSPHFLGYARQCWEAYRACRRCSSAGAILPSGFPAGIQQVSCVQANDRQCHTHAIVVYYMAHHTYDTPETKTHHLWSHFWGKCHTIVMFDRGCTRYTC